MAYGGGYGEGYGGPPLIITFEVAFDTDPGDTPVWTDLSDRLIQWDANRGRRRELDKFTAGRAGITLSNEDRALDPTYTSSPYWPNVVPMRRCRIRATHDVTTYDVFSGYIDSWDQQYMPPAGAVCVVQATDAFKVLANAELLSSVFAEEIQDAGPILWWRLGDPTGSQLAVESVTGTYPLLPLGDPTFGAPALAANDPDGAVQFSEVDGLQGVFPEGTFPFSTVGSVEFLYRSDEITPEAPWFGIAALGPNVPGMVGDFISSSVRVTLSNNAGGTFQATAGGSIPDNEPHLVVITWAAGSPTVIYVDGVDATTATTTFTGTMANTTDKWATLLNGFDYPPFPYSSGFLSAYDELILYDRVLTPTEVASHYSNIASAWSGDTTGDRIGHLLDVMPWPAADRNIDSGTSVLQEAQLGGSILAALQKVEETEQGALFIAKDGAVRFIGRDQLASGTSYATFGDDGSELEYTDLTYVYDDQLIFNEVQVTREGGITQVVGDPTSQTRYLRRTKVFDGMLYQTDVEARGLGDWWINHYKDPLLRATDMKLEPSAGNEATHFPQVLGRELMDRVTVRRRPQNLGAAIDQEALIEGISHSVTATEWVTTWNLSPAETQIYWLAEIAGHGEAGVTTYAGF